MLSRTAPRALLTSVRPSIRTTAPTSSALLSQTRSLRPNSGSQFTRSFQSSPAIRKGIHPESADPPAPNPQSAPVAGAAAHVTEPSPLTTEDYYEYSEHYFNVLLAQLEKAQEEGSDIEGEYSVRIPITRRYIFYFHSTSPPPLLLPLNDQLQTNTPTYRLASSTSPFPRSEHTF
jgi:frataxin